MSLLSTATFLAHQFATAQPLEHTQDCPKPTVGFIEFARRIAPDHLLQSGAAGDVLIRQAVETLCEELNTKSALVNTCSAPLSGSALVALRDRLTLDLAAKADELRSQVMSPEVRERVLVAAAIIESVLSDRSLTAFARGLVRARANVSVAERFCGVGTPAQAEAYPMPSAGEPLARAGWLLHDLSRLQTDGLEAYRVRATQLLSELRKEAPTSPPTAEQEATLNELVRQIQQLHAVEVQLRASVQDEARLREHVVGSLRGLSLALRLLEAPTVALPEPELTSLALALAAGDPKQVLTRLAGMAQIDFSEAALQRVERLVALLRAETDAERKRIIRREILGLEPWPEDVLVDAHVGALMVSGDTYKLTGDLLLGYNSRAWGVALRGRLNSYDLSNGTKIDQTDSYGGTLESWLAMNPSRGLGLEGRLVLGGAYHDTTVTDGRDLLSEESILGRADVLAGVRVQRSRMALGVWAGGGLQLDRYTPTLMSGTSATLTDTSSDTIQGRVASRLRLQYQLLPDILAVRLAADAEYFHLTRATVTTTLGGSIQVEDSTTSARHVDARTRLYLDAEVARFFDFVPGIAGGFDLTYEKGSGAAETKFAPVVTAGIRRTSF